MLAALRRLTRVLYRHRGWARIAESLRRRYARRRRVELIEDFDGRLRFHCHLDEHMGSEIFWRGAYSESQLAFLRPRLRPDMTFFDAGANQGELTVFAAGRLPDGQVVAFEPVAELFARLERNVACNGFDNTVLNRLGLSDRMGAATVYQPRSAFGDGTRHEGLATLYPTAERDAGGEAIELTTLDDYLDARPIGRLDVLKIDVEGAELPLLRGAERTLRRYRPLILVELNQETARAAGYEPAEVLELLSRLGYRFCAIEATGASGPLDSHRLSPFQEVACLPDRGVEV